MKTNDLAKHIKSYWLIYAFCVQLVMSYTIAEASISDHERRIGVLESSEVTRGVVLAEINSRLASIETAIKFIEKAMK